MAKDWQVTHQEESEDFEPATASFHPVVTVHYHITSGHAEGVRGSVKVPAHKYSAEHVGALIERQVAAHHEVRAL